VDYVRWNSPSLSDALLSPPTLTVAEISRHGGAGAQQVLRQSAIAFRAVGKAFLRHPLFSSLYVAPRKQCCQIIELALILLRALITASVCPGFHISCQVPRAAPSEKSAPSTRIGQILVKVGQPESKQALPWVVLEFQVALLKLDTPKMANVENFFTFSLHTPPEGCYAVFGLILLV